MQTYPWILMFRTVWRRGVGPAVLAVCLATVTGCVTKARLRAETEQAMARGRMEAQQAPPMVMVVGEVKRSHIPWHAELTLLRAINNAEYYGLATPREIVLTRLGEAHRFRVRELMTGEVEDPLLEAGDLVEVRR